MRADVKAAAGRIIMKVSLLRSGGTVLIAPPGEWHERSRDGSLRTRSLGEQTLRGGRVGLTGIDDDGSDGMRLVTAEAYLSTRFTYLQVAIQRPFCCSYRIFRKVFCCPLLMFPPDE